MSVPFATTPVFDTYWRFAHERQNILMKRLRGEASPWTTDPILLEHKFTNVYRVTDRVSQYLIRHVIYNPNASDAIDEVTFRILLFKFFNKIETWEAFMSTFSIPTRKEFDVERYSNVLDQLMNDRTRIYSAAYIMPPASRGENRKHRTHLQLLDRMMRDHIYDQLTESPTMQHAFEILKSYSGIGDFLAYQFLIDINYSNVTDFSENDFVVAGPGARDGIQKCFSDRGQRSDADLIHWMVEHQEEEFHRLGLAFEPLLGRPLHLIDTQNIFCEVSKYARVAHPDVIGASKRTRIKQTFHTSGDLTPLMFPPKWNASR